MIVRYAKKRTKYTVHNNAANAIYVGRDNQLTTTNGLPIAAGTSRDFTKALGDDTETELWAIAGFAAQDVRILEVLE